MTDTAGGDAPGNIATAPFCGQCGKPLTEPHPACAARAELEPPRYCPQCARRMVVQVDPVGWVATCSRHGRLSAASQRTGG